DFCRPLGSIFDVDGDARSGQLEPRPYSNRPNLLRHTLRSSMIAPVCSPECGGQSPGVVRQPKVRALVNLTRTLCRRSRRAGIGRRLEGSGGTCTRWRPAFSPQRTFSPTDRLTDSQLSQTPV